MRLTLVLKHLQGLFLNPKSKLEEIAKSYYVSWVSILKEVYLIFFFLICASFLINNLIHYSSIKKLLISGIATPVIFLLCYIFFLYLLSIVMEEVAHFMGGEVTHVSGAKLSYFSSLPILAAFVLYPVPYLGSILVFTTIIYKFVLILMGATSIMHLPSRRVFLWMVAVMISFVLFGFLIGILLVIFWFAKTA